MFNINSKELQQYEKNLKAASSTAFPKAVRSTVDRLAYLTVAEYKKNVKKTFVVRNPGSNIILKSIRYEKSPGTLDISKMEALIGQGNKTFGKTTDQLRKQEFGETLKAKNNHIVKPTKFARGGSYKRVVKQENFMSKIKVKRISDLVKNPADTQEKQFRQAIGYIKRHPGQKIYFLPSEANRRGLKGIAQLQANGKKSARFVYSLKDKTQPLTAQPILQPAGNKIGAQSGSVFKNEAQRRITSELSKGLNNS